MNIAKTTSFNFTNCNFNGPVSTAFTHTEMETRGRSQTRSQQGVWEG